MSVLTVVRHTRTEEETGRLELIGATVVGRYAPLTAALLAVGLANLAVAVLVALGLIGVGLPAAGSVALGLAIGADRPDVRGGGRGGGPADRERPLRHRHRRRRAGRRPSCCGRSATPGRRG